MNRIRHIRERLGVTQAVLANGIGCTQGNVSAYEVAGQTVPPDVAARLISYAASLGVHLSYDDIYVRPPKPKPKRGRPLMGVAKAAA